MNTNEMQSFRSTIPTVCLILLLISVALLLALTSCLPHFGTGTPADTASPGTEESTAPSSSATDAPDEETSAPTFSDADEKMLLYYVALVEELQEEIRQLKAENFILSASKDETENDAPVSKDPADDYTYEEQNGAVTILSYTGSDKNPTVPAEINGLPVTAIGENAFSDSGVVSVVLPDTVTVLDWFAFANCASLRSVTAGASLTSIGYGAFDGCPAALTLICPDGSYLSKYGRSFGIAVSTP